MNLEVMKIEDRKILTCTTDEGILYQLSSRYFPDKYQKIWARKHLSKNLYAKYHVFGLGDGSYLRELLKIADSSSSFIVYEPKKEILDYIYSEFELNDILKDKRVTIISEEMNDSLSSYFCGKLSITDISGSVTCVYPNYPSIFRKEYDFFTAALAKAVHITVYSAATVAHQHQFLLENTLVNMRALSSSYNITALRKIISPDMPILIAGAGPSLTAAMPFIRQYRDKIVIMAVDSAIPSLLKHDIIPHFFISVDPAKEERNFEDPRVACIPCIIPILARACICKNRKAPTFFYKSGSNFYKFLNNFTTQSFQTIDAESSVSNHAFGIAMYLKSKNVLLTGVDLAFLDGKAHSEGALLEDLIIEDSKKLYTVTGVNGETLYTDHQMDLYRKLLEDRIKLSKDMNVINTSETGAYIRHTVQMSMKDALEKYCKNNIGLKFDKLTPIDFNYREAMETLIDRQSSLYNSLTRMIDKVKAYDIQTTYEAAMPIILQLDSLVTYVLQSPEMELVHIRTMKDCLSSILSIREKGIVKEHIARYIAYLEQVAVNCKIQIDIEKELI